MLPQVIDRALAHCAALIDEPPPDDEPDVPTPKHSAHHPVVVSKHESCADGISKGADLLLPKHELEEVGFPWKFPEISGNFRRSAVGGRWSSPVLGGRLTSAGGQISLEISGIVFSFEGSDFQKNV